MENIMRFESLWESAGVAQNSRSSIREIRLKILKVQLEQHKDDSGRQATIEVITKETMRAVKWLLDRAEHSPHRMLRELHSKGKKTCGDPIIFVQAMISLWRKSATPFLTRDINFGATRGPESLKDGNIGLLSMLLTAENWTPPNDARLQAAMLIANSATSVVFAAYLIGHDYEGASWKAAVQDYHASGCVRSFLKCAWQVARRGSELHPGAEFGAFADEVKLAGDGKHLLVQIGRGKWTKPAYWHPCKKVPGSPWNKFLKNKNHPIFQGSSDTTSRPSERIMHRMPNTAIKLAEVFEDYYADIRARMDQMERPRRIVWGDAIHQQHSKLASATGLWYPETALDEDTADEAYDARQEYIDTAPLAKRPISDSHGHSTLPFLSSAAKALRFRAEPEDIETDLWVLTFGGNEGGNVSY